jgi:hypothetical protein
MIAFDFVYFGVLYQHVSACFFTNVCFNSCIVVPHFEVAHGCVLI